MANRHIMYDPAEETGVSWPAEVYPYKAGVKGGFLGGLAMIVVGLIYGLLVSGKLWLPINLIGATVVRDLQGASLETLAQFNAPALVVGLILHMTMAVAVGLLYTMLLPMLPGDPLIWAVVVGPLLWGLAMFILPMINPVMQRYLEPISFVLAHVLYGLVLGLWVGHTPKQVVRE